MLCRKCTISGKVMPGTADPAGNPLEKGVHHIGHLVIIVNHGDHPPLVQRRARVRDAQAHQVTRPKGVVVAATASSAVPNTLMLLSLSIVKVFISVSPLATLCAAHDMDHSEVLERQGKSEQESSLVNGWR